MADRRRRSSKTEHAGPIEPAAAYQHTEQTLGLVLRIGVTLAAAIVLVGMIVYLIGHGSQPASFGTFKAQPPEYRSPLSILRSVGSLSAASFIQLGFLVLILTPILRVAFSVYAFARMRDYLYVGVTLVVLIVLGYGLLAAR